MEEANDLLGHPHFLVDKVHYGFRLGHKLGAPTINMRFAPASWCRGTGSTPPGYFSTAESASWP